MRLERLGFRVIGDLQQIEEREAILRLGEDGLRLWRLAQGRDDRSVSAERETKSNSVLPFAMLRRVTLTQAESAVSGDG